MVVKERELEKKLEKEEESQEEVKKELDSVKETMEGVESSQEEQAQEMDQALQGPKKGFSLTGSAKNVAAGLGGAFGAVTLTSILKPRLTMGFLIIVLSFSVDLLTTALLLGGNTPLLFHLFWGIFLFYFVHDGSGRRDPLVWLFLAVNVLPAFLSWAFGNYLPNSSVSIFIANTIGNPFFPWWSFYAGFVRNPQSSKLLSILFWLWIFLFLAVGYTLGEETISEIAGAQINRGTIEGQKQSFAAGAGLAKDSAVNLVSDYVSLIVNIPNSIRAWIEGIIDPSSQVEEEPELGIRVVSTSYAQISKKEKQFKAILQIEETGDINNFLEVTDVECFDDDSGAWTKAEEALKAAATGENIKVYSRFRRTVTCPFFNEEEFEDGCPVTSEDDDSQNCLEEEDFEELDRVKLFVDYDFTTKASLTSYIMREDLLEELLTDGQNPLDFIFEKGSSGYGRRFSTRYDNGPASVSIGPEEFNTPPLGVDDGKEYPDFQLTIRNNPLFKGSIEKVKDIWVKLPEGFKLRVSDNSGQQIDGSCPLRPLGETREYITDARTIKENEILFSNIKSKPKGIACDLIIDPSVALGDASFSEVIFDANVNFIYRIESRIG